MNHLMIQLEQLSLDSIPDETKLMEITDSKVLAQVTNLIPELFKAGNAAGNAVQGAKANAEVLYRAIIPAGAKLANSREMDGAVRGIYHGAEGVKGHANLLAVKKNSNVSRNVAASAMNLASMVVGQYYMNEINEELGEISAGITKISEFQDNEYKSKVFALVAQIQKVAIFQVDILDNDELRLSEIYNLNRWEQECIQLLGQANLTIAGFGNKENLDYEEYEKQLAEAQNWFVYQKTLMEVMIKIAELKHTLHLGSASREQCGALLPTYSKQVQDSLNQLSTWHKTQTEKFEINVDEKSRKRMGLDGVIYFIPGLINEENKFCSIPNNTVKKIIAQTNGYTTRQNIDPIDLFQEDVRIIAKEGRIYYLPKDVL
ncbi:hypothetical protein KEC93_11490 [Clostridium beijerinckii]|nr:hypothetical protein KEC93_11490 [Clostridium beijerinckii]